MEREKRREARGRGGRRVEERYEGGLTRTTSLCDVICTHNAVTRNTRWDSHVYETMATSNDLLIKQRSVIEFLAAEGCSAEIPENAQNNQDLTPGSPRRLDKYSELKKKS
ncbi:hypothetical protein PoB_002029400 [Plakobranchus ocellatus]|uniref:Uncharacterized protein n=1 Tax=Plakobranchus ocellatus TaxID=259542 RepID=A0AAV3ZIS5_9GAST|nr:hypothetical protein PoB_002029400 [Plakobranchus ocellatus]